MTVNCCICVAIKCGKNPSRKKYRKSHIRKQESTKNLLGIGKYPNLCYMVNTTWQCFCECIIYHLVRGLLNCRFIQRLLSARGFFSLLGHYFNIFLVPKMASILSYSAILIGILSITILSTGVLLHIACPATKCPSMKYPYLQQPAPLFFRKSCFCFCTW